jgi:hypothetical protein
MRISSNLSKKSDRRIFAGTKHETRPLGKNWRLQALPCRNQFNLIIHAARTPRFRQGWTETRTGNEEVRDPATPLFSC